MKAFINGFEVELSVDEFLELSKKSESSAPMQSESAKCDRSADLDRIFNQAQAQAQAVSSSESVVQSSDVGATLYTHPFLARYADIEAANSVVWRRDNFLEDERQYVITDPQPHYKIGYRKALDDLGYTNSSVTQSGVYAYLGYIGESESVFGNAGWLLKRTPEQIEFLNFLTSVSRTSTYTFETSSRQSTKLYTSSSALMASLLYIRSDFSYSTLIESLASLDFDKLQHVAKAQDEVITRYLDAKGKFIRESDEKTKSSQRAGVSFETKISLVDTTADALIS